jgi:hypothetical protein
MAAKTIDWIERIRNIFKPCQPMLTREGRFRPPARDFNIMAISTGRDCASASRPTRPRFAGDLLLRTIVIDANHRLVPIRHATKAGSR